MATPTKGPQQPRFAEEIKKMEYEPIDAVESKLIWYTFSLGIVLLVILVAVTHL